MKNHKWHYKTISELRQAFDEQGYSVPFYDDISILNEPLTINGVKISNRIVYQPMEGGDSHLDGTPGEQTIRRYNDFARGGPGIVWVEAVPVLPEAKSNPRQLYLHEGNLPAFKAFVEDMRSECYKRNNRDVFIIIQFTHSGRYSRPFGKPAPIAAHHNAYIERGIILDESAIIGDDGLKRFEEAMGNSAALAEKAGFDGADVKCCHGYLVQELLTAYDRPGPYGGSFENRTRCIMNCIRNARASTGNAFLITSRLNMFDGFPHPWGFGAAEDGTPDLAEPLRLVEAMRKDGIILLNLTSGNPHIFTIISPRDNGPEHPLAGIGRMHCLTGKIKEANKDMIIVSSAYSYLREFSAPAAAGSINVGLSDFAGFGRMSFAYPDVARDVIDNKFDTKKACMCCVNCGYPCRRWTEQNDANIKRI